MLRLPLFFTLLIRQEMDFSGVTTICYFIMATAAAFILASLVRHLTSSRARKRKNNWM
jgi:hypothetical protein